MDFISAKFWSLISFWARMIWSMLLSYLRQLTMASVSPRGQPSLAARSPALSRPRLLELHWAVELPDMAMALENKPRADVELAR